MADPILSVPELMDMEPKSDADSFICVNNPVRMGNAAPIAYGGCALGVAVMAAFHTLNQSHDMYLYSLTGIYLGPARSDKPLHSKVTRLRDTKTFSTRSIAVSQEQDDGSLRSCLTATADFMISPGEQDGPAVSILRYSDPPLRDNRPHHSTLVTNDIYWQQRIEAGDLDPRHLKALETFFAPWLQHYETKNCPDGLLAQTLNGFDKQRITTLEHLPMTQKSTSQWIRSRTDLKRAFDSMASRHKNLRPSRRAMDTAIMAFMLDGALSFVPLVFTHRSILDAAACSSLDFAARFFVPSPSLEEWVYQEHRTIGGGFGRTFSEGRVWSEDGTLLASMTQACILRPKPGKL